MRFVILLSILFSHYCLAKTELTSSLHHWPTLQPETQSSKLLLKGNGKDIHNLQIWAHQIGIDERFSSGDTLNNREELMIIKQGSVAVTLNGAKSLIGPGSVILANAGDAVSLRNPGSGTASFYRFSYSANSSQNDQDRKSLVVDWNDITFQSSDTGGRRDFFNLQTSAFKNFKMHVSTLNEGLTNHPLHTHSAEEFVLMLQGDVLLQVGEKTFSASKGDLVFMQSMIPHSLHNTGEDETIYFAFQFWN